MKVGIDIDGVLTDIASFQLERGTKHFGNIIHKNGYEIRDIFNCSKKKEKEFWLKNLDYYTLESRSGSSEFTNYLHNIGHELYIITARNLFLKGYTKFWLKKNNIFFDKIIYSTNKLKSIKDYNINVMIEDSPKNIILLHKYIPIICMKAPYNEIIDNNCIHMVSSFEEIYNIIEKLEKQGEKDLNNKLLIKKRF